MTLVTEVQARKGVIFIVRPSPLCKRCKLFKVCVGNLRPYASYRVEEVRRVAHRCPLTGSTMRVVVVEELPVKLAVSPRRAIKGAVISYQPPSCDLKDCRYRELCFPRALKEGDKGVVKDVLGETIECPKGRQLKLILLLPS